MPIPWECCPHTEKSDYYGGPDSPGFTIWPDGAVVSGLSVDSGRLINAAADMRTLIADMVDAMDGTCEFAMWDDGWQEIYLRCKRILEGTNEQDRRVD